MSKRRAEITLLCEDFQQAVFIRRFLNALGWKDHQIRPNICPPGSGSAEQWVRKIFPKELRIYRASSKRTSVALIAVIDADNNSVSNRFAQLQKECTLQNVKFRNDRDCVAIAVPKRNIETWIRYLNGENVDEDEDKHYSKLDRERLCAPAVKKLVQFCKKAGLPSDAPPSLAAACGEYNARIKPCRP